MQLDESNEPMRCTLLGAKTLSIFQLIVLGIPAVVLTLLSIIVCPCVVLGCGTTNRERGEYAVVGGIRFTFHPTGVCTSLVITSKESQEIYALFRLHQWSISFHFGDHFCRHCFCFRSLASAC